MGSRVEHWQQNVFSEVRGVCDVCVCDVCVCVCMATCVPGGGRACLRVHAHVVTFALA